MTRQEIETKVTAFAAKYLYLGEKAEINPTDSLRDQHGMDSLDHVQITIDLEKEFGIQITDAEHEQCQSVSDFTKLVETKLNKKQ